MTDAREADMHVTDEQLTTWAHGEVAAFSANSHDVAKMARELLDWREWNDVWDTMCATGHTRIFYKGEEPSMDCPLCALSATAEVKP